MSEETETRTEALERLVWRKFHVLDDGFVCLVDVMGDDAAIVQAARVSYGKDTRDGRPTNQSEIDGGTWGPDIEPDPQQQKKNRDLIRYLMRHRHTTPYEMAEVKLLVRVPMDCWRQWIRHRTANVNETSTRYTEAIDSQQKTPPDQWRLQSGTNKQGSSGFVQQFGGRHDSDELVLTCGEELTKEERTFQAKAREVYENRLSAGVAREQARKDLPLSTYTEAYWKIDLHNLFHFLSLRMDAHAQLEIRQYATIIGEQIVKPLFPLAWEAFEDYRIDATTLTGIDKALLCILVTSQKKVPFDLVWFNWAAGQIADWEGVAKCRERDECLVKLQTLGIVLELKSCAPST